MQPKRCVAAVALLCFLGGAGLWLLCSKPYSNISSPTLMVPYMNIDVKEVPNAHNIPIWAVNHREGRILTVTVCFQNAGYSGATKQDRGLSDVLCSLLDEGYAGMNGRDLKLFFLNHSIDYNITPDADHIIISMRTIPEKVPQLFEALTGMVTSPTCLPDDVKRVQEQLYANLSQRMHMPQTVARDKRMELAYSHEHPYAFSTKDQTERMMQWTPEQIKAYARNMFTRERLRITIVGAYQHETLHKHMDAFIHALPQGEPPSDSTETQTRNDGTVTTIHMPVPQTVITWMQEGLSLSDPRFYALYLANEIMGGGSGITAARLMREIREKNGLAYGVGSRLFAESNGLGWVGSTATQTVNAQKVIDMIRSLWCEAVANGFTQEELDQARSYVVQSFPHSFRSTTGIAGALMRYMLSGRTANYVNTRNDFFQNVTLEDLNRVCKEIMQKNLTFVAVGDHEQGVLK